MLCIIRVRGARRAGIWSEVDRTDDMETACNVARSWHAKGYHVRIDIGRT